MSGNVQTKVRSVEMKVAGEYHATADLLFTDTPDLDRMGYKRGAFPGGVFPVYRQHEPFGIGGGSLPPFGVIDIREIPSLGRYRGEIDFLKTHRGTEEYQTTAALAERGVKQPLSVAFKIDAKGPVPTHLAGAVDDYVTSAHFIEVSFVAAGAIPGAQILAVKSCGCTAGSSCGCHAAAPDHTAVEREVRRFEATVAKYREPVDEAAFRRDLARFHSWQGTTPGVAVHPLKAQTAADAVRWCADWWGLRFRPGLKFLNRGDMPHADWVGFALGGDLRTAHIASDRHGWDLVDTALHETCHIARRALGLPYGEEEVEADVRHLLPLYAEELSQCLTSFAGN